MTIRVEVNRNVIKYNHYMPEQDEDLIRGNLKTKIETILPADLVERCSVFYFNGEQESNYIGNEKHLYILINSTKSAKDKIQHDKYGKLLASHKDVKEIKIDNDIVANYFYNESSYNVLNILIDPIVLNDDYKTFETILRKTVEVLRNKDNWGSENKEDTIRRVRNLFQESFNNNIERMEADLRSRRASIDDYKRRLLRELQEEKRLVNEIANKTEFDDKKMLKVVKEFDMIVENDKITSLKFKNGKIIFTTVKLNFFDENGQEYKGGEYTVTTDLLTSQIKIESTYTVNGGWSRNDPHPHVDGDRGRACFGNATSTLVQLLADNEYYAYTMMMINYLQASDTTDVVGMYSYRWGKIDENGEVYFEEDRETIGTCDCCGESIYVNEEYSNAYDTIYEDDYGDYQVEDEVLLCSNCRDGYYYWNDDVGEYVLDN